jgi:hypothetical protein
MEMSTNLGTVLSNLLNNSATSGLATTILNNLGQHLTVSQSTATSIKALLDQMQQNPGNFSTLNGLFALQQNVPAGVSAYVEEAAQFAPQAAAPNATAADKAPYVQAIVQAKAALAAATSQGTLGSILSAL